MNPDLLLLLPGFILLIKGADILNMGAAAIALRFGVSDTVAGLTVVAFGTSLPELFVTVLAGLQGSSDLAVGNILGSNIANILLILGGCSLIAPLAVQQSTLYRELPYSILAALVLAVLVSDTLAGTPANTISRVDGVVLLCFFTGFMYYILATVRNHRRSGVFLSSPDIRLPPAFVRIAAGLAALLAGGSWIVNGASQLAAVFGVSEGAIGLTIIAAGTSLPELAAAGMAVYRKKTDLAVGNVIGSNIFNIFCILGIGAVLRPISIHRPAGTDIAIAVLSSLLLLCTASINRDFTIHRRYGVLFLLLYAAYIFRSFLAG